MSHEIETASDGRAAFAAARQPAWHRLGTVFEDQDSMTPEQALTAAHLAGWNVRKRAVTSSDITDDGVITLEIPDTFGVWRDNPFTSRPEILLNGTVGSVWDPYQNEEMIDFLDAITGSSGAGFETAGSINGGRDVFVTMKLPEGILVGGKDRLDLFLCAFNNHTGKRALRLSTGGVRVVCKNTQDLHLATAQSVFTIRHTTGMRDGALEEARKALDLSFKYVSELQAEADRMINAPYTEAEFEGFVAELCGTRKELAEDNASPRTVKAWEEETGTLRWLFHEADTQAGIRGTRWGAYQAFVEYLDWYSPVRSKKASADEVRALRTINGDYPEMKAAAYKLLKAGS